MPKLRIFTMTSYVLYHNPYSICSLMVRYTVALRGAAKDVSSEMHISEKIVDIYNGEQLEEDYLSNINPLGQVRSPYQL